MPPQLVTKCSAGVENDDIVALLVRAARTGSAPRRLPSAATKAFPLTLVSALPMHYSD